MLDRERGEEEERELFRDVPAGHESDMMGNPVETREWRKPG